MRVDERASDLIETAVLWRHQLHEHPELAYHEVRTADFVAQMLDRFGLKVHRGLGVTGVVGTLSRGTSRRVIAIRADMDALPIQEESGVPHASRHAGVMHACGHDGHVAMALAAAGICARMPDIDGTVHFIFQPAEENEGGARRMMEQGLFKLFPCDAIYALHNWPALPLGSCVALDGPMMAAFAVFEITISGRGCHGAMPHEGTDCVLAGAQMVSALHSIVSRSVDPLQAAVISVTQLRSGDTWNVIPDTCVLRGTARWFDDNIGNVIEQRIREVAGSIAAAFATQAHVRYERRFPATINHPAAAQFARTAARDSPAGLRFVEAAPSMSSEDFSFMLQSVPGCYIWLGAGGGGNSHGLHSPRYDFNDALIPLGVEYWTAIVRKSLTAAR